MAARCSSLAVGQFGWGPSRSGFETVAYHEMGHALLTRALPGADVVHKVSIIPRGIGALGYTMQRPTENRYLMTREELQNKISVLLGGRAAEQLVFGVFSTGAADDLARATVEQMRARPAVDSAADGSAIEGRTVGAAAVDGAVQRWAVMGQAHLDAVQRRIVETPAATAAVGLRRTTHHQPSHYRRHDTCRLRERSHCKLL